MFVEMRGWEGVFVYIHSFDDGVSFVWGGGCVKPLHVVCGSNG